VKSQVKGYDGVVEPYRVATEKTLDNGSVSSRILLREYPGREPDPEP
jgi:hypothetical protein